MNKLFKEQVIKLHTETYTNPELCDIQWGTILGWEFAHLFNKPPKYFNYYASSKDDLNIYTHAHTENYDAMSSFLAIKEEYKDDCVHFGDTIYTEDGIISTDSILVGEDTLPERIKKCLKVVSNKHHFLYASMSQGGFTTRRFPINEISDDILDNYNDDLPVDKFEEFINMNKSGIAILHGIAGSGNFRIYIY